MVKASKVVTAGYRILATSILGYYLIKETVRKERYERRYARTSRDPDEGRGGGRDQEGDQPTAEATTEL